MSSFFGSSYDCNLVRSFFKMFRSFFLGIPIALLCMPSVPALAGSAKDDAIKACRLHPACSVQEVTVTCKGDTKCIVDLTNKRTKKTVDKVNDTADKASKGIRRLFKN